MKPSGIDCTVEGILTLVRQAAEEKNEEQKQALASMLYLKLSEDANVHENFYRLLTYDTGQTASRDHVLQGHLLSESCPLDNGRHEKVPQAGFFRRRKVGSCGLFGTLPLHLLHQILEDYVDIASLTTLRGVNRGIRAAIDSVPKYAKIIHHTVQSIRAALSIQVACAFTCDDLWKAFVAKECVHCHKFGAYLYLPTCSRVCYKCAMESNNCCPLDLATVKKYYSITKYELVKHGAPIIDPLPGRYHSSRQDGINATNLVDITAAAKVAAKVYGVSGSPFLVNYKIQSLKRKRYVESLSTFLSSSAEARRHLIHKPDLVYIKFFLEKVWLGPHRFKCMIPFPWFDRTDIDHHTLTMGVSCRGCFKKGQTPEQFPREDILNFHFHKIVRATYTHRDYIDHFLGCRNSIQWLFSNPDALPVPPSVTPAAPSTSATPLTPGTPLSPLSRRKSSGQRKLDKCGLKLKKMCGSAVEKMRGSKLKKICRPEAKGSHK